MLPRRWSRGTLAAAAADDVHLGGGVGAAHAVHRLARVRAQRRRVLGIRSQREHVASFYLATVL